MIAAGNGWVVAFDNLSYLSPEMSDALCCLARGFGFATRTLHTDDDETLIAAAWPLILNGIEDMAT
jgi:putative DNA primase/helicase